MSRKVKAKKDPLVDLVEELKTVEDEIKIEMVGEKKKKPAPSKVCSEDVERKRAELLKASERGEIEKTPLAIGKASAKVIEKTFAEWKQKKMDEANTFICDQLISKFSALMGGLDAIEKPEEMEKELKNDPLLRANVETAVAMITPWIPLLGVLSGGITVGKHVLDHTGRKIADGFARGPFGGEKPPEERSEEEYDTVN